MYDPINYTADRDMFISELMEFAERYADENQDKINVFGTIEIPAADIIVECLLNHVDNGEVVDIIKDVCDIEYDEEENISISIDYDNITTLYELIAKLRDPKMEISCNYDTASIGITIDKYRPEAKTQEERYFEYINSGEEVIPIDYLVASEFFSEDVSSPLSEKHRTFDIVIESLYDIFKNYYSEYSDDHLMSLDGYSEEDEIDEIDIQEINICNSYKAIKSHIFDNCNTLRSFYEYMSNDSVRIFGTLIGTALFMCEYDNVVNIVEDSYETLRNYSNNFMKTLELLEESNTSVDENSLNGDVYDELSDEPSKPINSYTDDNNTNNNEEVATYSEEFNDEEDEEMSKDVLEAIIKLTDAVETNSKIMGKQNELIEVRLNSFESKIDEIMLKLNSSHASIEESNDIVKDNIKKSNDDLIMLSENELSGKIIAVNVNNSTICFDILELAKKATESVTAEYLTVTDITVNNL